MTVNIETRKEVVVLTSEVNYDFTFRVDYPEDVKVTLSEPVKSTDPLTKELGYTENDNVGSLSYGVELNTLGVGGVVELGADWTNVYTIATIYRDVPTNQLERYVDYDTMPASTFEMALDKLTFIVQQIEEALSRSLTLDITVSGVDTELPIPEAGKALIAVCISTWSAVPSQT